MSTTNGTTALAMAATPHRGDLIKQEFRKWSAAIDAIVPSHMKGETLRRIVVTAISQTPKLAECTPISLVRSTVQAAMLGLTPNDGRGLAYLIPYKRSMKVDGRWVDVLEAQFQPGYRGLEALAYQSGVVKSIRGKAVHEGDGFEYEDGMVQVLRHMPSSDPAYDDKGREVRRLLSVYAVAVVYGDPVAEVMYRPEIERIMRGSQAWQNAERGFDGKEPKRDSPWHVYFDRQAIKTVIKRLLKNLPVATEKLSKLDRAVQLDDHAEIGIPQALDDEIEERLREEEPQATTLAGAARAKVAESPAPPASNGKPVADPNAEHVAAIKAASDEEQARAAHQMGMEAKGTSASVLDVALRERIAELKAKAA